MNCVTIIKKQFWQYTFLDLCNVIVTSNWRITYRLVNSNTARRFYCNSTLIISSSHLLQFIVYMRYLYASFPYPLLPYNFLVGRALSFSRISPTTSLILFFAAPEGHLFVFKLLFRLDLSTHIRFYVFSPLFLLDFLQLVSFFSRSTTRRRFVIGQSALRVLRIDNLIQIIIFTYIVFYRNVFTTRL